jgi:class 3 adenylate cyclase
MLKPLSTTNLGNAVQLTARLRPEKALVALLTDGCVLPQDLLQLAQQTRANKVIAAVVSVEAEGVENLRAISDKIQLFEARPDKTGKTIISMLPKSK